MLNPKFKPNLQRKKRIYDYRPLLMTFLLTGSNWLSALPLLAANSTPGTVIDNQATGSFTDPNDSNNEVQIESNVVQVEVAEVAGITISQSAIPEEAPSGVTDAGANQGNGDINPDDVIYFTYKITNVGNDPTQFFIPDAPSSVNNGSLNGNIQIIEYDPDGASAVDLTSDNITVPSNGDTTGSLLNGVANTNDGSVPVGGSITIRVPIKADSNLSDGDTVTVIMGDTGSNDNSAATQNQVYAVGTNDVYTEDNPNGTTGETDGTPINGDATNNRQEASFSQDVTVSAINTNPFSCARAFYQVIDNQLKKLDPLTGNYLNIGSPAPGHYNAAAYNSIDNFIYGYGREGSIAGHLVKISQDGALQDLGAPTKIKGVGSLESAHSGDFDNSGNLWLRSSASGAFIYRLNVQTNEYEGFAFSQDIGNVADLVYINGKLYGAQSNKLYIIDITNPVSGTTLSVTTATVSGLPASTGNPSFYGAAYTDIADNLYVSRNTNGAGSGELYQVIGYDTGTPKAVKLVDTQTTNKNDGMSCPNALPPLDLDLGDAPDSGAGTGSNNYNTLAIDEGPLHIINSNIYLGSAVTADTDGFGDGTDNNGDASDDANDDGVQLSSASLQGQSLTAGQTVNLDITTAGSGKLSVWFDWNQDGDFDDADEKVATDIAPSSNAISLPVNVPATATEGTTYARFRYSSQDGLTPTGTASDGEVEDYQVEIAAAPTVFDYGDAPNDLSSIDGDLSSAYPTLDAENGAKHTIDGSTFLGSGVNNESDGQPTLNADGDTDDGVTFPTLGSNTALVVGQNNTITVEASKTGVLNAWVDWNQDGDWDDPGEQIATNEALSAGSNTLNVNPGTTTPHGATYARFRFSSQSNLSPTGAASDGEVEDYKVNVVIPEITACLAPLLNGGFESPAVNGSTPTPLEVFQSGRIVAYRESEVDAWAYISSNPNSSKSDRSPTGFEQRNAIELWRTGNLLNVPPHEGNQFAEINAYILGNLHQDIITTPGVVMRWQFAHRGRTGNDTIRIKIGAPGATVNQGEFTTGNTEWKVYSGTYTVPVGQTITRFEFEAVSTANGDASTGNFIDDIRFGVDCNNSINGTVFQDYGTTTDSNTGNDVLDVDESGIQDVGISLYQDGGDGVFGDGNGNPGGDDTVVGSPVDTDSDGNYNFTGLIAGNYWVDVDTDDEDLKGRAYGGGDADATQTDPRLVTIVPGNDQTVNFPFNANNPNVLLIKRITKINDGTTTNDGDNLSVYNQDSSNPYDDNELDNPAPDPIDTDKWLDTTSDTSSTFLIGGINGGTVKPDDELEYTIYYLSAGDTEAENVLFCDRVPENVSFIPTSFNGEANKATGGLQNADRGIQWLKDGNTESLTNVQDGDVAQYFPPGVEPSTLYPKIKCDGTNTNGAVVVNLGNLPNATAPGTPNTSYGFVRFRGKVK